MFQKLKTTLDQKIVSDAGTPLRPDYVLEDGSSGAPELHLVGYVNFDEKIQADLEDSKVYSILNKYMRDGDASVLNRVHGQFFDATGLPKSLREAQDLGIRADRLYESLDPKVKSHFGYDKIAFMQEVATNGLKFMEQFKPAPAVPVAESEVVS